MRYDRDALGKVRLTPLKRTWHGGFTLVEIVIALTIVIILAAGAIPAFKGIRAEQAARHMPVRTAGDREIQQPTKHV